MSQEQSIRERLKNGTLVGGKYSIVLRQTGTPRAVIDIEKVQFTVDDSTRPLRAGMVHSGRGLNKRKHQLPELTTQEEVDQYFDSLPQLGAADFIIYDRKHEPRGHGNPKFNCAF